MADTGSVHPEPGEDTGLLAPTLSALSRLRRRLVEESGDPRPDPRLCRLSWVEEEASTRGLDEDTLLSWIGIPRAEACRHCFGGWIFEPTEDPLEDRAEECHMCLGTGARLTRAERENLKAEMDAEEELEELRRGAARKAGAP